MGGEKTLFGRNGGGSRVNLPVIIPSEKGREIEKDRQTAIQRER